MRGDRQSVITTPVPRYRRRGDGYPAFLVVLVGADTRNRQGGQGLVPMGGEVRRVSGGVIDESADPASESVTRSERRRTEPCHVAWEDRSLSLEREVVEFTASGIRVVLVLLIE